MTQCPPQRFALLIDADNLSGSDLVQVFDYLDRQHYQVSVRRAYGGHEKLGGMKDFLRQRAVRAFVNQGKGTTDVALTVDAMDLLHSEILPLMVGIASSDADFAPLALRLREAGIRVLCFANRLNAAPEALFIAYDELMFIDEIAQSAPIPKQQPESSVIATQVNTDRALELEQVQQTMTSPAASMPSAPDDAKSVAAKVKTAPAATNQLLSKPVSTVPDDPEMVRRILQAVPNWLPNTVQPLNQLGAPLRTGGIAKGSKPLHELFRKHPAYFKVQPSTGPAKQVKLLKKPS